MSFTPKFVDLVKNQTSVQNTGPVVLGTAPAGFTGFAQACAAGDQFYYCIQGTDKPAEREVGKGTLQADGTVLREPLAGQQLTKFTGGAKTISLVTAAEWFGKVEQSAAANPSGTTAIASRALLATEPTSAGALRMLSEAGREGWFLFVAGNQSARVSADPRQGMAVAPASDPSGASGAWVRQAGGSVSPDWFGAVGDDVANDDPAFAAAIAWLRARSAAYADNFYKGSMRLAVGAKTYFLGTTTLELNHTLTIEGEGTGQDGGVPSRLRWAAGTTGIRVHAYNTVGDSGGNAGGQQGGDGSIIRGLFLLGGWNFGQPEAEAHGIQLRARALVEDCYIYKFEGDGIFIRATAGGAMFTGNANLFQLNRISIAACRDGIQCRGADANGGFGHAINAQANRRWGINDQSFLGNAWTACHTADNGLVSMATPTVVSNGTTRYCVKIDQEAGAATNAPSGTTEDNAWWLYNGDGGPSPANNIPLWSSGMAIREGGSYRSGDANSRASFSGCYSEGGQGVGQLGTSAMALGGMSGFKGAHLKAAGGALLSPADLVCERTISIGGRSTFNGKLKIDNANANEAQFQVKNGTNMGTYYFGGWGFGLECYDAGSASYQPIFMGGSNFRFFHNATTLVADMDASGIKLAAGKALSVAGQQVVGARQAAIADHASDATVNAMLGAMRAHGLIAP